MTAPDMFDEMLSFCGDRTRGAKTSSLPHPDRVDFMPKPTLSSTEAQCCHNMKLILNILFYFFPWTPTRKWRVSSSRLESDISSWEASSIRIVFAEYFSSPVDAVSWQHSVVWGTKQHHRNFCWISECLCTSFLPYVTLSVSPWHQTCHDK